MAFNIVLDCRHVCAKANAMNNFTHDGPRPKQWIANLAAYTPGKAKAKDGGDLIKLSANENPLGCSPKALATLRGDTSSMASGDDAARYPDPDCKMLRAAIAELHDLPVDQIICGSGSGELLGLVAMGYAGQDDDIIYSRYGFSLYDIIARRIGATSVIAPDKDYSSDLGAILAAITPKTRVIYLANPNNPTGTIVAPDDIAQFAEALPSNIVLVLDQAYAEYLDNDDRTSFALARQYDNILITRTFSKIYGLAAHRIGWAFGASGLIDTLNRIRAPFNVTTSGQAAAIAALSDQGFVETSRRHNAQWRQWLTDEISNLGNYGLTVTPSHANFILVHFNGDLSAEAALHHLAGAGYMTRWMPKQDLADSLRITIGSENEMRGLAQALRDLLEKGARQ